MDNKSYLKHVLYKTVALSHQLNTDVFVCKHLIAELLYIFFRVCYLCVFTVTKSFCILQT